MRLGCDIVEVARVARCLKSPAFAARVFSAAERELLASRGRLAAQTAAGNFCAKEAFAKALGTGFRGMSLREIAVLRDGAGAPFFVLEGEARARAAGLRLSVSISHCREYATAVVAAEEA